MEMVRIGGDEVGAADACRERGGGRRVAGDVANVVRTDGLADGGRMRGGRVGHQDWRWRLLLLVGGCRGAVGWWC